MGELRRRVSVINTFYKQTSRKKRFLLSKYSNADISKAMLSKRFVFVLFINILPDVDKDNFENFNEKDYNYINQKWYNDIETVGKIR